MAKTKTVILLRISLEDRHLIGATADVKAGFNHKFWPDAYEFFPKGNPYSLFTAEVTQKEEERFVSMGKRSQYFKDGFEAFEAMDRYCGLKLQVEIFPSTAPEHTGISSMLNLADYYTPLYCVKGGKHYEKPEETVAYFYSGGDDIYNLCVLPEGNRKKAVSSK